MSTISDFFFGVGGLTLGLGGMLIVGVWSYLTNTYNSYECLKRAIKERTITNPNHQIQHAYDEEYITLIQKDELMNLLVD